MGKNLSNDVQNISRKPKLMSFVITVLCLASIVAKIQIMQQDDTDAMRAHKITKENKTITGQQHTKIMLGNGGYAVNLGRPDRRDFWKTSNKMCKENGMRLPTKEELLKIHFQYKKIPHSGWYWTSDGVKNDDDALRIYFNLETGDATVSNWGISDGGDMVLCIKNKI
jgi:hypothetical protein